MRRAVIATLCLMAVVATRASADSILYVTGDDDAVRRYDGSTGAFIDVLLGPGAVNGQGITIGPDGAMYAMYGNNVVTPREVRRFDASTGAFLGTFATGFSLPRRLAFGPGGFLYGVNANAGNVRRHDGATGAFDGLAASGLQSPDYLTFDSQGRLYVSEGGALDDVRRFDPLTGALIDVFIPTSAGGLGAFDGRSGIAFGPDGNFYMAVSNLNRVLRFDGTTGAFIDIFVTPTALGFGTPTDIAFGQDGNLYVADIRFHRVMRYDGTTGSLIDVFVAASSGGLVTPRDIHFATVPGNGTPVPEPGTLLLFASAGTAQLFRRRFRSTKATV